MKNNFNLIDYIAVTLLIWSGIEEHVIILNQFSEYVLSFLICYKKTVKFGKDFDMSYS